MDCLLCPTRGGTASVPNQDRAIAIAQERGLDLLFLYVSDVQFLNLMASPILVDIEAELEGMGEFMLTMAQERAEKAGLQAKTAIRRGVFRQALQDVIREHHVTTVVLGSPTGATGVTTSDFLQDLVQWILSQMGLEVIVVKDGQVVEHYQPVSQSSPDE